MTKKNKPTKTDDNTSLRAVSVQNSWAGPLPPPGILAQYNDCTDDGADRIIAMAEKQQAHRHELESADLKSNIRKDNIGMWFAFILYLIFLLGSFFLIYIGKEFGGYAVLGTAFLTGAGAFLKAKKEQREQLARHSETKEKSE